MAASSNRWKLGLFVMLTVVLSMVVLVWLGASRLERASFETTYFFDEEVSGLEVGSPVKFRGVSIGKVVNIRAAPDRRHVEVTASIFLHALHELGLARPDRPDGPIHGDEMPSDLCAQLIRSPLTGVAFIQNDFFDNEHNAVPEYPFEIPWNTLHTVKSTGVTIEKGLVALSDELPKLIDGATRLVDRLDEIAEQADVEGLSKRLQRVLEELELRLTEFDENHMFEQTSATLAEAEVSLAEIRALAAELRAEDGPIQVLANRYAALGDFAENAIATADLPGTMSRVRTTTEKLGSATDELGLLSRDVRRDLDTLWTTLASIKSLADLLERDPGALLRGKAVSASSAK